MIITLIKNETYKKYICGKFEIPVCRGEPCVLPQIAKGYFFLRFIDLPVFVPKKEKAKINIMYAT